MTSQEGNVVMTSQDGNVVKYLCELCGQESKTYPLLVMHMAIVHFLSELKPFFGEAKGECGECHTVLGSKENLAYHLVCKHNALSGKIPTKSSFEIKIGQKNPQTPHQQQSLDRGKKRGRVSGVRKWYACHKCDKPKDMYCRIVRHIATVHYKDKLCDKYDRSELKCIHCDQTFPQESALIGHLVCVHDELKDFLPTKESLEVASDADESEMSNFEAAEEQQVIIKCNLSTDDNCYNTSAVATGRAFSAK